MNKELEESINRLKLNKKYVGIFGNSCIVNIKDLETVLNYIENSISKEVIEKKIEEVKSQCGGNVYHVQQTLNAKIRLLQELLEG